jgi:hypothetical protein
MLHTAPFDPSDACLLIPLILCLRPHLPLLPMLLGIFGIVMFSQSHISLRDLNSRDSIFMYKTRVEMLNIDNVIEVKYIRDLLLKTKHPPKATNCLDIFDEIVRVASKSLNEKAKKTVFGDLPYEPDEPMPELSDHESDE